MGTNPGTCNFNPQSFIFFQESTHYCLYKVISLRLSASHFLSAHLRTPSVQPPTPHYVLIAALHRLQRLFVVRHACVHLSVTDASSSPPHLLLLRLTWKTSLDPGLYSLQIHSGVSFSPYA